MAENIRIDSHKLIYHPGTVADWLNGENIYPIEIEISPSGACNHRCIFCALDYMGYEPNFLKKDVLLSTVKAMHDKGLKSVVCAGEGEPLLNRDFPEIANTMKEYGLDVAMSTNGVLLTKEISKECLGAFKWIRFSVASLEKSSYHSIQCGADGDLEKVCENIQDAVKVKRDNGLHTTLGVQCLLIPQNIGQIVEMAKKLREFGVDYFTVKPYMSHTLTNNSFNVDYSAMGDLEKELKQYETDDYQIYFRIHAMEKMKKKKTYSKCYALPFMVHIDAKGNVWPCVELINREGFSYGNIYKNTFDEIWNSGQRRDVIDRINQMDLNVECSESCRMDEMNRYLCELKHLGGHVNFI